MDLFVGTSGFSYKEWKGPFYPPDLKSDDWLRYYAGQFSTVEINNTFYRMPKAAVVGSWAEQVPNEFRFAIKAPRRITHIKRLKDVEAETAFLFENLSSLGARLGTVLVQLPPNLPKDVERLDRFLAAVPDGIALAFEFRNPSWHHAEVLDRLRERDFAVVASDTDEIPDPALAKTASWGYLRLRRAEYDQDGLRSWATRLASTGWDRAFVFFKHEDEARGPLFAKRFLAIARGESIDS